MKSKYQINHILFTALIILGFSNASSAVISIIPSDQEIGIGGEATIALTISGLGTGTAPSLGTFDLDISYRSDVLSINPGDVVFGDPAGSDQLDINNLGSITEVKNPETGVIRIFELSLDDASDLDSLQADSFTLATLTFKGEQIGISPVGISVLSLVDASGQPLSADLESGSIRVVPLPGAIVLFGSGIIGLLVCRVRQERLTL